jgi:hypothetical protein
VERLHRVERGAFPAGASVRLSLQADNPNARVVCAVLEAFAVRAR